MEKNTKVACPNCGADIDVQDILAHQLEDELKQKFQAQLSAERKRYEKETDRLKQAELEFEAKKKKENELFQDRLETQLKSEKKLIEEKLKVKMTEENEDRIKAMQTELQEKSEQVKELHRSQAEIEKLKREKGELKELAEAEAQKRFSIQIEQEKEKIRKVEADRTEMKFREMEKQLEDQKKLTEEMKRKQEQGSMQLQGEVQELAIEEWLMSHFPLDTIDEIKKGIRGGDCMQIVNTRSRQNCGMIYYESKRSKDFSPKWIEKFRDDIREKGADIGVLVTEVMPSGMERMGMVEGVWVCNYEEFKGLCAVLRDSIIRLSLVAGTQENKGEKMQMLYDFLTSPSFKLQMEAIVDGFTKMKSELDREKRAMQRIWKEREKQLDKVLMSTAEMYGSVRGIAGNAIQPMKALELPGDEDEEVFNSRIRMEE
jgi:hypothetical protein